jgi:hypothetical protein
MELFSKRCFDIFGEDVLDQVFPIIDKDNKILYYYIVDFDVNGVQTNVYKTYTKDLKSDESKLLNKKLITLNNVLSKHENLVKVVDKEYEADINQDEYVVVG